MRDLIPIAIPFVAGFACAWFLDWRSRRALYATMAEQQRTIARLRRQATSDVTAICDLREQLEAEEQAQGLWRSFDTMAGKN